MFEFLIARTDAFNSISRSARRSTSANNSTFFYLLIGAIAVVWGGLYLWDQWRKSQVGQVGSPKSLFVELCAAHKLTRPEQSLLLKATKALDLEEPAMVFADPRMIGRLATAPGGEAEYYGNLSTKLFGR
jgi:hypothetical protein